ncbi:MAG: PAS domain S-box protein [Cytophagaceae bacterium]
MEENPEKTNPDKQGLRKLAEEKVRQSYPDDIFRQYPEDKIKEIIHELQVHQVELEMQNEELIRGKMEYEILSHKFQDLYEFAPVGYFTLDQQGIILKSNYMGSKMLGREKKYIIRRRFQSFIHTDSSDIFHLLLFRIFSTEENQSAEIKMIDKDGHTFFVQLDSSITLDETSNQKHCRMTAIDISERKKANEIIQASLEEREKLKIIFSTQEEERRRIAESLHDNIAQLLYVAQLKLEELSQDQQTDKTVLKNLRELLEQSVNQTRTISFQLMPPILEDFGLIPTLKELCEKNSTKDLLVQCSIAGYSKRMDSNIEITIYRISQELINNISKHASASKAELSLIVYRNSLLLRVEDNGKGFDIQNALKSSSSMGLKNIKNRIKLMNGELTISSPTGEGTKVVVEIPWQEEAPLY